MDPGLTIVLLGNSGVGKSASGNTILGRPAFESKRSSRSVTTEISEQTGTVFGKQISVVDTPGILGSERKIQTWCQRNLQSSRPRLFLIVVKTDRFTIEQKNAVDAAVRVIGDQEFNNCYLLFTGGDDLNDMMLDDFINEDPESPLKRLAKRFGRRLHLFNNKNGGQEQVRVLLEKSGHLRHDAGSREPDILGERRMVLLGLPGDGKSSSGNTILGSNQFQSGCNFNSVSTETVSGSATVEGRQVTVVDTPGITAEVLTPRKLFEEIMKSVKTEPHAFIIVVKIGRICEANTKMFKMLAKLFGRDARKYMMVLFTHGDQLRHRQINDLVKENSDVQTLVSMCADRYCVFDNSGRENRMQVRKFLNEIEVIVRANNREHYTSEMFFGRQSISVKISVKWHELGEWFTRKIRKLDARRSRRYNRFDVDTHRDSVPLLPQSSKND